ncbi:MAG: hypothetical protein KKC55_14195 [Gammaproteobacteria bacterium]|nr:hypothetical protein [Gammaproteobacteria bacterium]
MRMMDLIELNDKLVTLEDSVRKLLQDFQDETGLMIKGVHVYGKSYADVGRADISIGVMRGD